MYAFSPGTYEPTRSGGYVVALVNKGLVANHRTAILSHSATSLWGPKSNPSFWKHSRKFDKAPHYNGTVIIQGYF